jgi:putative transport protein
VGHIPISLPGGLQIQLGLGGGAFLVALLLGHWGNNGPVRVYVPHAVKQFAREVGLVIFLAGAGAGAGSKFVAILQQTGPRLLVAGALITLVTVAAAVLLMFLILRWNVLYGAGALTATMTNPPGLAAATALAESDAAAVGFASVYPVALISKIVFAPLVFLILRLLG